MSDETKDNELQTWIEPELEARVVALVLGEAGEFEAAELERIIAEKPELAIFKRRMEAVHGLVAAACKMELDPMRMETGRRERLLDRLGRKESTAPAAVVAMRGTEAGEGGRIPWVAVAAAVAVLAILMGLILPPVNASKSAAMRQIEQMKLAETAAAKTAAEAPPTASTSGQTSFTTAAPAQPERLAALDSLKALAQRTVDRDDDKDSAKAAAGAGEEAKVMTFGGATVMSGPDANAAGHTAKTQAQARLGSEDMPKEVERDYNPDAALDFAQYADLRHNSRRMIAGNDAVLQHDAQQAEKQLGDKQYEQREISAADLPAAMAGRTSGGENLAKNDQSGEGGNGGGAARTRTALAGANSYTGATTLSGGTLAMAPVAATTASDASSQTSFSMPLADREVAAAAPAAAPAAMPREAPAIAGLARAPLADKGGAARQKGAAKAELADIPVNGPVFGQIQNQAAKAPAESAPMMGQAEYAAHAAHAAQNGVSEKKDFGFEAGAAGGAKATGGLMIAYGSQIIVPKGDLAATTQTFALNRPAGADADLATRMLQPAQKPIGRLPVPATDEVSAADQPYSTFSLHVSDVSFLLAKAALAAGQLPDPDSIRPEEFYNAFDYGDPAPATGEKIACRIEQAAHPMLQQRNLVRIAMKVAATGRGQGQHLRLTVLLDTSGSMERDDRAASIQKAMEVLTSLLGPNDAVTLIGFARQPRLLAEEVPGNQAAKLVEIVKHTPAEGGTNMEEAIKTATELALRHYDAAGQNRVVMLTDGAANLGDANPGQLARLVERLRQQGVSFDACGVGADGFNDDILEALTRKGGGRYYFLNQPEDADEGFARQLAGAFRPAAENVKMQVRFNPDRVGKYRLIGFEKHRLNQEDFRNDKVTAAQLAAEEAAVALYQVQVLPEGEGEIGEVFVRFRDPADGRMIEQSWTIPYDAQAPALDKASRSMQLAATAALVAEKLRGGPEGDAVDLDALEPIVGKLRGDYAQQARVGDFVAMFEEVRRMTGGK